MNEDKSELEPKQVFNFVGYQFDLKEDRPTPECWQTLQTKIREIMSSPVCPVWNLMSLIGLLTASEKQVYLGRLHMRPIQWHLKNNWRVPETMEKTIPIPNSLHPHLRWWLEESNVLTGQPLHPLKRAANLYRRIKRRVGRSLKRAHGKRKLVTARKQTAHKLSRVKGSSSGLKRISEPLYQRYSPHSYRQHDSGCLHKQGRGNEVGPSLCSTMENPDLVYQETGYSQSSTHPWPSERDSRQAIRLG